MGHGGGKSRILRHLRRSDSRAQRRIQRWRWCHRLEKSNYKYLLPSPKYGSTNANWCNQLIFAAGKAPAASSFWMGPAAVADFTGAYVIGGSDGPCNNAVGVQCGYLHFKNAIKIKSNQSAYKNRALQNLDLLVWLEEQIHRYFSKWWCKMVLYYGRIRKQKSP